MTISNHKFSDIQPESSDAIEIPLFEEGTIIEDPCSEMLMPETDLDIVENVKEKSQRATLHIPKAVGFKDLRHKSYSIDELAELATHESELDMMEIESEDQVLQVVDGQILNGDKPYEDSIEEEYLMDIVENGIPRLVIQRPPVDNFKKDTTRYKKIKVHPIDRKDYTPRIPKNVTEVDITEEVNGTVIPDTELEMYVKELKLKNQSIFAVRLRRMVLSFRESILRKINNVRYGKERKALIREMKSRVITKDLPQDIKSIPVMELTNSKIMEHGRVRDIQRDEDRSAPILNAVRNKKTGVVTMIPARAEELKTIFKSGNYEIVESVVRDYNEVDGCNPKIALK